MSITNNGGLHGFLTIVYGESVLARRDPLWRDLHQISGQVHSSPRLVAGDFIILLDTQVKRWEGRYSVLAS